MLHWLQHVIKGAEQIVSVFPAGGDADELLAHGLHVAL